MEIKLSQFAERYLKNLSSDVSWEIDVLCYNDWYETNYDDLDADVKHYANLLCTIFGPGEVAHTFCTLPSKQYLVIELIEDLLNSLFWSEAMALRLRFGLSGSSSPWIVSEYKNLWGAKLSLAESAKVIGITKQQLEEIEAQALRKLRHPARSDKLLNIKSYVEKKIYKRIDLEQGSSGWLKWRASGVGGSDAPTVMRENPWQSYAGLFKKKLDGKIDTFQNSKMSEGHRLEDQARKAYIAITGNVVTPSCMESLCDEFLKASVDGISEDGACVVEIKCGAKTYDEVAETRKVPKHYYGQLQHILLVTGLSNIDFFCYRPDQKPILINVMRDSGYILKLSSEEQLFHDRVTTSAKFGLNLINYPGRWSSIGELGLSNKTFKSLEASDIFWLIDLCKCSENELLELPDLGISGVQEITDTLAKYGLVLGIDL
jgi:putative phage-type endonuclease